MKSPALILHQAQRDRIRADMGLEVYDEFPGQDVTMPYIVAGEIEARDWSDKFKAGQDVVSTTHVWSGYPGRKECAEILDKVLQALSREDLALGQEFHAVCAGLDLYQIIIDIDGVTRHGILKFRYLIEEL